MTLLLFSALLLVIVATYNRVFSDLGQAVCTFMYGTFGYGCYLVIAAFVTFGLWLVFGIKPKIRLRTTAALALTLAVVFMLFQAVTTRNFAMNSFGGYIAQCYSAAEAGYSGYTFGGALSGLAVYPIARGTTFVGAYIIFSVLSAACLYLTAMSVRGDIILARGGEKKIKPAREPRSAPAPVLQQQAQTPEMPDNVYTVDNGQQIVNNFHPVPPAGDMYVPQPQPAVQEQYIPQPQYDPQPEQRPQTYASVFDRVFRNHGSSQDEDDRFSNDKLGRKIIFEKGEFAAESYRRNMIFDEDSYFNHPVRTGGDGSGSSSSGASSAASPSGVSSGIVSSASAVPMQSASQPASQPAPQQPSPQPEYPQSYTDSYSEEVEGREQGPSTPSYIYGDKPAESLDDIPSEDYDASDSYYGDISDVRGGDYPDVYDDGEPYYTDDDMSSPVHSAPVEDESFEDFSRSTRRDGFTVGFSDNSANRPADDLSDIPVLPSQSRDRGDMAVPERRTPSQPSADGGVQAGGRSFSVPGQDDVLRSPSLDDDVLMRGTDRRGASEDEPNDISGELGRDDISDLPDISRSRQTGESDRSARLPSLREESGRETLFDGASMVITSCEKTNPAARDTIAKLTREMGFKKMVECSAAVHDRKIAYTSQLAHIVSNAYVKDEEIESCSGFTGGSFQDMTRIAGVDEGVWSELYMLNRENLSARIRELCEHLSEIGRAIEEGEDKLRGVLRCGRERFSRSMENYSGEDIKITEFPSR